MVGLGMSAWTTKRNLSFLGPRLFIRLGVPALRKRLVAAKERSAAPFSVRVLRIYCLGSDTIGSYVLRLLMPLHHLGSIFLPAAVAVLCRQGNFPAWRGNKGFFLSSDKPSFHLPSAESQFRQFPSPQTTGSALFVKSGNKRYADNDDDPWEGVPRSRVWLVG